MSFSPIGTLYAIGVGPGAPDLITLRAINILSSIDVVFAAASPKNDDSIALAIAQEHIPTTAEVLRLNFPMTKEKDVLQKAWEENTEMIANVLQSGKNAAFLTLGDPLIYSTFGYIMRTLKKNFPTLPLEVIPGITSFQAAAALTKTILCEGNESLTLTPGINSEEEITKVLDRADAAVILKTYRNADVIYKAVSHDTRCQDVVFASRLGMDDEHIEYGIENAPKCPPYLSLLLVTPKR